MPTERGSFESGHDIQDSVPGRVARTQDEAVRVCWGQGSGLRGGQGVVWTAPESRGARQLSASVTGLTLKGMVGLV